MFSEDTWCSFCYVQKKTSGTQALRLSRIAHYIMMLRKYEVDSSGQALVTYAEVRTVKLKPFLTQDQLDKVHVDTYRNQFTSWLLFNVFTHELSHVQMNSKVSAIEVGEGKHNDNLMFMLVGTTYRLVSKTATAVQQDDGVFCIDVQGYVHDDELRNALQVFVKEHSDFVWKYNSFRPGCH